ncbi:Superoxide dismutase [Desulfacinum hydrothermale DSM 13146]|uniref:superoxide dismutase n=1 Tax=Desulfacinum hydrothermale DSM 13146 TaxID=1121390 RepID=A0A1W1XTF3_9BACT|nr:Fe-Mn family superoxide dismutase [Desulfacinum hydrothermale]SMC27144.1 Superoxide dismutase [Desulfacinum hydrothermale DSM 13146]
MKKKLSVVLVLVAISALVVTCRESQKGDRLPSSRALQPYQAKDFSYLLGMEGFSEALLKTHFALYQGYVTNTNKLLEKLRSYAKSGRTDTPEYAELKRRLGFEFNGMKLHEYYFGNLGGAGVLPEDNALYEAIKENFGSFENWKEDFLSTGKMRGIGWVILYQDPSTGRLVNTWINEHETGHLTGCVPLVVLDVFEHAYLLDYGLDRAAYMDAFFKNLDWKVVLERFGVEVPEGAIPEKPQGVSAEAPSGQEEHQAVSAAEEGRHEKAPAGKGAGEGHEPEAAQAHHG